MVENSAVNFHLKYKFVLISEEPGDLRTFGGLDMNYSAYKENGSKNMKNFKNSKYSTMPSKEHAATKFIQH